MNGTRVRLFTVVARADLAPFVIGGFEGMPLGILALLYIDPEVMKFGLVLLLICYVVWVLAAPVSMVEQWGGKFAAARSHAASACSSLASNASQSRNKRMFGSSSRFALQTA